MKQQRKRENAPKIAGSGAFSRMMDSQKGYPESVIEIGLKLAGLDEPDEC